MRLSKIQKIQNPFFLVDHETMIMKIPIRKTISAVYLVTISTFLVVGCHARLEAALVLPHGDFAWDPNLILPSSDNNDEPNESATQQWQAAHDIASSARRAGTWLAEVIRPDVIFLSTPHGIAVETDFALFLGNGLSPAFGSAVMGQDPYYGHVLPTPYTLALDDPIWVDTNLSTSLLTYLQQSATATTSSNPSKNHRTNVTGLYLAPDPSVPIPLHWAEVIPLLLIPPPPRRAPERTSHGVNRTEQRRRHIVWSHPHRRYNHAVEMVDELLKLGAAIASWMDRMDRRFAVVISGDLGHTHNVRGPYGYAPAAALYDQALNDWANTTSPCSVEASQALLERARSFQPKAMSCGFTGMVLLQGMLCGPTGSFSRQQEDATQKSRPLVTANNSFPRPGKTKDYRIRRTSVQPIDSDNSKNPQTMLHDEPFLWESQVLVNRNVTYYGMMVAQFWRHHQQ